MAVIMYINPEWQEDERHQAYWQALGKFIYRFALVEQQIHFLLNLEVGISRDVSTAIFSSVRSTEALTFVAKIRKAKEPNKERLFFDKAKGQFSVLMNLRNTVAHYAAKIDDEGFIATDEYKKMPASVLRLPVSAKILSDAVQDLETISACIYIEQIASSLASGIEKPPIVDVHAQRPFLYKEPPQARSGNKTGRSDPKQQRPPEPSRDKSQK